jgi:Transposase DDE domain/Transposase domain (DUF772)
MKLTLRQQLTQFHQVLQNELFPVAEERVGELDERARRLVAILELIPLSRFVPCSRGWQGRPSKDRCALAAAFVAKAVYGLSHTRQLLQSLKQDERLRRICGWTQVRQVPHEATFSRAFAEFAQMELPHFVHEALIAETQKERLIGHIARDSTAIEARERFPEAVVSRKERAEKKRAEKLAAKAVLEAARAGQKRPGKARGPHRRYKGGKAKRQPATDTRLHRQRTMQLAEMLADLPRQCSLGVKTAHDGNQKYWRGYKLHLDVADGQIPISGILTGANVHDSQVAIPLATMTAQRVTSLYDVMDSAYDATEILEHSRELGHVPIVKPVKRRRKYIAFEGIQPSRALSWAEEERFKERTSVERVYARLKDEFGGREIRVRGARKIMAHLMFAVLALTADQILRLVT